jgi:hypothetical protein
MEDAKIILAGLWVATMLIFLWGDVLTMYAGDLVPGEIGGTKATQPMWVGIAALMTIPIIMIVLSLTLNFSLNRRLNIIVAGFWIIFNLISIQGYPAYNKFLLVISMGFNVLTVWYAWKWVLT